MHPRRSCVACRKSADKPDLIRFVLAPDGEVVVDYRKQLPGRGVYTCFSKDCLLQAIKKNGFRRLMPSGAACRAVTFEILQARLRSAVLARISGLLGIARKSGQCISGSNQVLDSLKGSAPPPVILIAGDITPAMGEKLERAADRSGISRFRLFDKQIFGQMLGKEERSVLAVTAGSLADTLLFELHRYELVREI